MQMLSMTRRTVTAVLAGASLAWAAGFTTQAVAADPIQIGAPLTLSPPGAVAWGLQIQEGLEIAKKMINDDGGVIGRPFEILYEDTQGNPERVRSAVEKLITRDSVTAITGIDGSPAILASIEIAKKYNVPFINTNGWADAIREKGYPQVFSPNTYISLSIKASVDLIEQLAYKRIALMINNDEAGRENAKGILEQIKARNLTTEVEVLYHDRQTKDFLPVILPLKSNPPEMILMSAQPPGGYIMMKQLYEQGVAPTAKAGLFDQGAAVDAPDFWPSVGEAGKYMMSLGFYHPTLPLTDTGKRFVQLHNEAYGRGPGRLAFQAADSLLTIATGIRLAGSTESDAIQAALREGEVQGTRGVIKYNLTPGKTFQQWTETPYVVFQFNELNQPIADATIISAQGVKADPAAVGRPD